LEEKNLSRGIKVAMHGQRAAGKMEEEMVHGRSKRPGFPTKT
jgi:hypothetical protein